MPPFRSQSNSLYRRSGFTLIELLATLAIVAMLTAGAIVYIGNYVAHAQRTANQQALLVLNDALTRYKTEGGGTTGLTIGASIGNVLRRLSTPINWNGLTHQFLRAGVTYPARSLSAYGSGGQYKFTRYGSYADPTATGNAITTALAAKGASIGDATAFNSWLAEAFSSTGSTNYLALVNPSGTSVFGFYTRVASAGKKVRVWWGDGTTSNFDSIPSSGSYALTKTYSSSTPHPIVIVGDLSYMYSAEDVPLGGPGCSNFGGDISTMKGLTYVLVTGNNTLGGDISNLTGLTLLSLTGPTTVTGSLTLLTGLTYIQVTGNNTLSGSISNLTSLQVLYATGNNTITGNLGNLSSLQYLNLGGTNTCTGWETVAANATGLSAFYHRGSTTLSSAQVNAVLAGLVANKDISKPRPYERYAYLNNVGNGAPTGQGITDKAFLVTYKSPNNTGPMVWTISTN